MLLDEPFGALDPGIRTDMHALITQLWNEYRLTVIMVTHDARSASYADRVVGLVDGEVFADRRIESEDEVIDLMRT